MSSLLNLVSDKLDSGSFAGLHLDCAGGAGMSMLAKGQDRPSLRYEVATICRE